MMSVGIIIRSLNRLAGGPPWAVAALASALADDEIEIHFITLEDCAPGDRVCLTPQKNVHLHVLEGKTGSSGIFPSLRIGRGLERICKRHNIGILHNNGLWLYLNHAASAVSRRLKRPLIVSTHGALMPWAVKHKQLKKKFAWLFYQKSDLQMANCIVVTSSKEAEHLRELGLKQPIAIVPIGMEMPTTERASDIKPECMKVALFLGRIHPVKGLVNLVSAWDMIRPENWKVVIAGPDEGNHRKEILKIIASKNLEASFVFKGFADEKEKVELYRNADLFILPSFTENFGVAVAEALAYGVPVITTKGAPWDILQTHRCGWWVETGVEPLAEAIREATALSDLARQEMGKRGRLYIERDFSWPEIAGHMISVYEWVLKLGPKPECVETI